LQQVTKVELIVNLKTAKALGLTFYDAVHASDSAVTAPHCVEVALLTEIVDDLHQVRLQDPETLRDVLDRRELTVVKPDLNEDAQREIGMKS
jgi:hypothetical protein